MRRSATQRISLNEAAIDVLVVYEVIGGDNKSSFGAHGPLSDYGTLKQTEMCHNIQNITVSQSHDFSI